MKQSITAPDGCKIVKVEHDEKSLVIVFDKEDNEPKFKKGDFLINDNGILAIFDEYNNTDSFSSIWNSVFNIPFSWGSKYFRKATEEERTKLLETLHKEGKDWDAEKCEVVLYRWEPKDGEPWFWVNCDLTIGEDESDDDNFRPFADIYNCFRTEAEAQKYADKIEEILKKREL